MSWVRVGILYHSYVVESQLWEFGSWGISVQGSSSSSGINANSGSPSSITSRLFHSGRLSSIISLVWSLVSSMYSVLVRGSIYSPNGILDSMYVSNHHSRVTPHCTGIVSSLVFWLSDWNISTAHSIVEICVFVHQNVCTRNIVHLTAADVSEV